MIIYGRIFVFNFLLTFIQYRRQLSHWTGLVHSVQWAIYSHKRKLEILQKEKRGPLDEKNKTTKIK